MPGARFLILRISIYFAVTGGGKSGLTIRRYSGVTQDSEFLNITTSVSRYAHGYARARPLGGDGPRPHVARDTVSTVTV